MGGVSIISSVDSILHNSRHVVIGGVPISISISSGLLKYHPSALIGGITINTTVSSVLSKYHHGSKIGSVPITLSFSTIKHITHRELLQLGIGLSSVYIPSSIIILQELISTLTSPSSQINAKSTIVDGFNLLDNIRILLNGIVAEGIGVHDATTSLLIQIGEVIESLIVISQLTNTSIIYSTILEVVSILDAVLFNKLLTISEGIGIYETLSSLQAFLNTILDTLTLSDTLGNTIVRIGFVSDSLKLSSAFTTFGHYINNVSDSFVISIGGPTGSDTYLAYLLNPETNSVSTYSNYSFTCSTSFNGKYLLGNSSGLYEYGGTLDDATLIEARLKTVAYNFGTSNLKQVPDMYIGGVSSDKMIIKVNVDNKASVYYSINNRIPNLHTQRIKFGKGLIGRYFQFELITNSTDTDLESIEFYPIVLQRKL
jgi:hypothetical protein